MQRQIALPACSDESVPLSFFHTFADIFSHIRLALKEYGLDQKVLHNPEY